MTFSCENSLKLSQFAAILYKNDKNYPEHKQWCDEITYVYSGEGDIIHNDMRFHIQSGQIHLCFQNDIHQIIPSSAVPIRFYCIGFILDKNNPLCVLSEKTRQKINQTKNAILGGRTSLQPAFQTIFNTLHNQENSKVSDAIITNTLNYIFSDVYNGFLSEEEEMRIDDISLKESLLFYIVNYLRNNIYNIDVLKQLADDTGYSFSYMSHLFSQKMGQSLRNFFVTQRMDAASELLKKKSVTEVAGLLGYSSIHAFTRTYKSIRGELPSARGKKE